MKNNSQDQLDIDKTIEKYLLNLKSQDSTAIMKIIKKYAIRYGA